MVTNDKRGREKPIGTREWYDFVGQLADGLPGMHLGGQEATHKLIDMCHLDATSRVLDVGCGGGNTACLIARQYSSRVQGIDISEVADRDCSEGIAKSPTLARVWRLS